MAHDYLFNRYLGTNKINSCVVHLQIYIFIKFKE